jgi:hypothetical protein
LNPLPDLAALAALRSRDTPAVQVVVEQITQRERIEELLAQRGRDGALGRAISDIATVQGL